MRLIDADALKATYIVTSTTTNSVCHLYVSQEDINFAPTADAVPVSFILDKMSSINAEYINIQRLIDAEPETAVKRIGIATNLLCEYNTLQNLIREWKGNENNETD